MLLFTTDVPLIDTSSNGAILGLLITTAFGFLGSIATMVYQGYAADRSRRWAREDQKRELEEAARRLAEKTEETAQQLAQKTLSIANELADKNELLAKAIHQRANGLQSQISKNTSLTKEAADTASMAYKVGNDINRKIADNQAEIHKLQRQILSDQQIQLTQSKQSGSDCTDQLTRMETTESDTNSVAHEIKQEIKTKA